jgi:predicted MFS family arabinose efflux permease
LRNRIHEAASRIAVALTHRNFRLLWCGALTSSIGTWLIVTMTGSSSAFYLGLDSFAGEFPILLFTMIGGVVADRRDRRHMMLMSQVVQMIVAVILAVLIFTGDIQIWMVIALSFISGCAQAFGGPAYQSLIPTLVGKEHLPNAIALNSIQFNLARVIGPIVAAVALSSLGLVACFGLNAVSFLFVIAAILALRDVHVPPTATESMVDQMKGGLRYVRNSRNLMVVMSLGFIGAFLGLPLLTFLPVIVTEVFQRDAAFYAWLMTFSGAGAVTGALIIAYIGKHRHIGRLLLIFLGSFGAMMALFSLSRSPLLSAVLLFTAGALLVMCFSLTTSLAQLLAPPELRGRVVSIYMVAFRGGSPLGGLASGWLVTQVGSAPQVLLVNGLVLSAVAAFFLIRGHGLKDV